MTTYLTPPMQKGKEPPFYEMGDVPFQDLSRDLVAVQKDFLQCWVYGDNGQTQKGIDIRCDRKSGVLDVAQAKCYKRYMPADIVSASDKFLEHLEYWQGEGVKKFILIVACRISSTKSIDQVVAERQRFSKYGIAYEFWDAIRIRDILREHSTLIRTHITNDDYWIQEICDTSLILPYSSQKALGISQINEVLVAQVNNLSSVVSSRISLELEENRKLWREGRGKAVIAWIRNLRDNGKEWDAIPPDLQANIIRLEAAVNIDYYENYQTAGQLIEQAKRIDPESSDLRIKASLALHQHGPQAALQVIGESQDIDSICLRASFHLQLNQITEAINFLEGVQSSRNVEVHRLLSLGYLGNNKLAKAVDEIEKAKLINANLEGVQIADAMIAYFSALSPAVVLKTVFMWPIPIELDIVKSSDLAIQSLEKAAAIFLRISQNEYRTASDRLSLLIWHAACLACDFRKQQEAEILFGELLTRYPTDHRLIAWIASRNISTDLQKSRAELKNLVKKGSATTADIISIVMLDVYTKHTRSTLFLLEKNRKVFVEELNAHLWEYWYIETLIARNRLAEARKWLEQSAFQAELEPLKLLLLNRESHVSGDDQPFINVIQNSIKNENHTFYLLDLCRYYASKQKWHEVTQYADSLVFEIQTTGALQLASVALFNTGKFQECKDLIDSNKSLCYGNRLPNNLRLIYIQSMALIGEFAKALSDLQQLTETHPTAQNLTLLRNFYIQKGDQAGLRWVATLAKGNANIRPDDLMTFAGSVLWASRELAADLWRLAPTDQLSPPMLAEKMLLGLALGLDHELQDINILLSRLIGKQGVPIWQVTEEEAIEIIREQNQQKNELFQKYSSGEIPIHVLAKNSAFNLFGFYKNIIRYNNDPSVLASQKFPLYIRYGGRPSLTDYKEPESPGIGKLVLDVTSLLLLDNFSLLEVLEADEQPLRIPSGTILALVQMKDELERYQPEFVRAHKLISEYLAEDKIKVIASKPVKRGGNIQEKERIMNFLATLGKSKGYVVGFGSQLQSWAELDQNQENLRFVTCADVIESLRTNGGVTEAERITALNRLGNDGQTKTNTLIDVESKIYFIANTITQIAQTEVLGQICSSYEIWMENDELLSIRSSMKEERDRDMFASRLQELTDRVSRGLDENKYTFLPFSRTAADNENTSRNHVLVQDLLDTINVGQDSNSSPVVDDLVIQKHFHVRGAAILGIYEITWWLYKRGKISEERYFNTLNDFRRAELRYIPISSDEIVYYLKKANVENNALIENTKLKSIRSSFATSLLFGRELQVPSQPFETIESLGEFEYLLSMVHAVSHAIIKIWEDKIPDEQKRIKSEWIIENLFLDFLTLCEVAGWTREGKDSLFLVGLSLATFFLNGLTFQYDPLENASRKRYFEWVYETICEPRFKVNPELLQITVNHIKNTLSKEISEEKESKSSQIIRALSERLYRDLPDVVKAELEEDTKFLQSIGVEMINVIELGDILFPSHRFWNQLAKVMKGESQTIKAVQPEADIVFSPSVSDDSLGATFIHPKTAQKVPIKSTDFNFLINDGYDAWMDENLSSLSEFSREQLREQIEEISQRKNPADRLKSLDQLRKTSIGNRYKDLEEQLANTQTLDFRQLRPSSQQSLEQFFGFQNTLKRTTKLGDRLSGGSIHLSKQLGLAVAIARFSAFPVALPNFLLEQVRNLEVDKRNDLFIELSKRLNSPISRIHLIRILVEYSGAEERISQLIGSFFSDNSKVEIDAYLQLVAWITDELGDLPGTERWSPEIKLLLAWGHSNQIFDIFMRCSVPFDWLNKIFKEKRSSLPLRYLFSALPAVWQDSVYGGNLDWLSFKILGLGYALADHRTLSDELQDKLLAEAFPAIDLLKDRSVFSDRLSSFLSTEISEAFQNLITREDDRLSILRSSSLRDLSASAIAWLSDPELSFTGWQVLLATYRNQRLPDSLLESFDNAVSEFNFEDLIRKDSTTGFMSFYFSSRQAKDLSSDSQNHLVQQIGNLAKVASSLNYEIKNSGQSMRKEEVIALMLDTCIRLSRASVDDEQALEAFSNMVIDFVDNWKEARPITLRLLNRLIREIQVPGVRKLGKLLLILRSER